MNAQEKNADRLFALSGNHAQSAQQVRQEEVQANLRRALEALRRAEEVASGHPEDHVAMAFWKNAVAACEGLGIDTSEILSRGRT